MNYTYTAIAGFFLVFGALWCPLESVALRIVVAIFGFYLIMEYTFHPTVRAARRQRRAKRAAERAIVG